MIKVRHLVSSWRNFLQTRSEVFAEAPYSRPRLVAKLSAPIDERVAAIAVLRVFVAVGVGSLFWFATAWPAGDTFLIWVAIGACRFVSDRSIGKTCASKANRAIDLYALGHETVHLQCARRNLTPTVTDCGQETIRNISSLLQDPSPSHVLVAKGASKNGYDSCLNALASVDPNSTPADQIAYRLASFAVIRHRLNQQQSIVEYTPESERQPTKERRHAA